MILSVSRRTDIPRFYFDWFLNRLDEGFVLTRNPMNCRQVSRIGFSPETLDCIVFWTKNPAPMLPLLDRLEPYPFYVQFTINAYGRDIETNLPEKPVLIDAFRRLADKIGPERTVWRFSPVLFTERCTPEFQLEAFFSLARQLAGYTENCKLSFLDIYPRIRKEMARLGVRAGEAGETAMLANAFAATAADHGIALSACGDPRFGPAGIPPSNCIDGALISRITGQRYPGLRKDPGQRPECGCVSSIDIGTYDTCLNGCRYCYANTSYERAYRRHAEYDPASPLLCDRLTPEDNVTERRVKSDRDDQPLLFS